MRYRGVLQFSRILAAKAGPKNLVSTGVKKQKLPIEKAISRGYDINSVLRLYSRAPLKITAKAPDKWCLLRDKSCPFGGTADFSGINALLVLGRVTNALGSYTLFQSLYHIQI